MFKVKVSTVFDDWPLEQQTPDNSLRWGVYQFYLNDPSVEDCDYWVVFDNLKDTECAMVPDGNLLLITAEPPNVKIYSNKYLAQFDTVRCAHAYIRHPNVIKSHSCLPWHVGRRVDYERNLSFDLPYDKLVATSTLDKSRILSVITSNKDFTKEHRDRLRFVRELQKRIVDIDIFGRGVRDIEDKWDAISPYKYHVVIENGCYRDYWTEKISDCYLAGAYPFYIGCPNLDDYFPADSFTYLDINDLDASCAKVIHAIENDFFEKSVECRAKARDLCLNKYNFFAEVATWCSSRPVNNHERVKLEPEQYFFDLPQIAFSLKEWLAERYRRAIGR